jgi:hypothetical protein
MIDLTTTQLIVIYLAGFIFTLGILKLLAHNSEELPPEDVALYTLISLCWFAILPFAIVSLILWLIYKFCDYVLHF